MATAASKTPDAHLSHCLSQYLIPCVPGITLEKVIELTKNPELYPSDLAPFVAENPAYFQLVMRVDFLKAKVKEWIEEQPQNNVNYKIILERIFILIGKQAVRNLITCIRINRIQGTLPKKPQEPLPIMPSEQLKHALAAETLCSERGYTHIENAFIGGLHFDFLNAILTKTKAPRDALNQLPNQWAESFKTAQIAYELATMMKSFKWNEYVFASALALGTGRLLVYAEYTKENSEQSWPAFLAEVEKKKVFPGFFRQLNENKKFLPNAEELSSVCVSVFRFLAPLERAILYVKTPYYLKKINPDLYTVSALLHVSDSVARNQALSMVGLQCLKDIGLTVEHIKSAQERIQVK